jgi:hypothetical protein
MGAAMSAAWAPGERVVIASGALRKPFEDRVGTVLPYPADDTRTGRTRVAFTTGETVTVSDRYLVDADD